MALTPEDGTGLANADSYASTAFADTYHLDRGNTAWAALAAPAKEQAMRKATDYMMQTYRGRWKGRRVTIAQALDWPRVGVVLDDYGVSAGRNGYGSYGLFQVLYTIVPPEVQKACAELALRASAAELSPDLTPLIASETVGPISVSYVPGAKRTTSYLVADKMLAPLLMSGGLSMRAVRS